MIFVTVGTQLPFDRLIAAVDDWAAAGAGREVFAQIGPSRLRPLNIEHARFLAPEECARRMRAATALVGHAGMGTILTAFELGKPLVVMPRRAALGEHRNDHQVATARRLLELGRLIVAFDETQLPGRLDELDRIAAQPRIGSYAAGELVEGLRAFIVGRAPEGTPAAPAAPL